MPNIEKIDTNFNTAIPSVYGEALSYTQQVAYLQYKVNQLIDLINTMVALPEITSGDEGKVLTAESGEAKWSNGLKTTLQAQITAVQTSLNNAITALTTRVTTAETDIDNIEGDIASIEADITEIEGDITTLDANINTLNTNKQNKYTSATINLTAAWGLDNTQTVSVEGVTTTSLVEVSPSEASREAYNSNGVRCIAQGTGTLTFKCEGVPSDTLYVYTVIWN